MDLRRAAGLPEAVPVDYTLAEPEPTNTLAVLAIIFAFFSGPSA